MGRFKGFTLIELLATIAIIGILASVTLVGISNTTRRARDAKRQNALSAVKQALELYNNDKGTYPTGSNFANLDVLVTEGYMKELPQEPRTGATYYYNSDGSNFALLANLENKKAQRELSESLTCDTSGTGPSALNYNESGNGVVVDSSGDVCFRLGND